MKLVSITVEKYRSITRAHKIRLGQSTVLVGPNNEGKSNILRALVTAMSVLTRSRNTVIVGGRPFYRAFTHRRDYDWPLDFPVRLQVKEPPGESVIILEFQLAAEEIEAFREAIKSELNGTLPIRVALGQREVKVTVHKKGKGSKALSIKSAPISRFVAERLEFQHIPAIRTARSAQQIVADMVDRELQVLEEDEQYVAALKEVEKLQQPLLDSLSQNIKSTLVQFLPAVKEVKVQVRSEERYRALRHACEIVVDDGTPTLLEYKGDGVQSLAALGIMRHASESTARGRSVVIAIEEPESHLHPKAIHELREVIRDLSKKHQVVLTTHCPLFVDRVEVGSNVLVHQNKARPAKNIEELRQILGVRASDNLRHAELVLLVEGEEDRTALRALLAHNSSSLSEALHQGTLAIEPLGGAGNLSYQLGLIQASLCACHVFLDDDDAAKREFQKARVDGFISEADANFATCLGSKEAELEDLYDPQVYSSMIQNVYRVTIDSPKFRSARKWSLRMRDVFRQQGKNWDERLEREIKHRIAEAVAVNPASALLAPRRSPIDALVKTLEWRIGELRRH